MVRRGTGTDFIQGKMKVMSILILLSCFYVIHANADAEGKRDGDNTRGSYRVLLPDGRTQIVKFEIANDDILSLDERGDGDDTQVSYSVALPDGRIQTVTYTNVNPDMTAEHGPSVKGEDKR